MVDDQIHLDQRIDPTGVFAGSLHRRAHRGQVEDRRHPREVLQQDPRRKKRQFGVGRRRLGPVGQ